MQFAALAQTLLRRWWVFALFAAIGLGQAYLSSSDPPREYESTATLQLNPAAKSGLLLYSSDSGQYVGDISTLASSYAEVLRSRAFGQVVVDQMHLNTTPEAIAGSITARLIPNT